MADFSKDFQITYDDARKALSISFRCFDVPNSITIHDIGEADNERFSGVTRLMLLYDECMTFHRLWSFSLPESDVCRLNERVGSAQVDGRTALLIAAMKRFNSTEPLFDFTIGPTSYLWKHADSLPSADVLAAAMAHVGADKVKVNRSDESDRPLTKSGKPAQSDVASASVDRKAATFRIEKTDPLVQIDVGGAAKGFAADWVVDLLREFGVKSADVDFGGNLYMLGDHPSGRPWKVAIRVPDGLQAPRMVLEVRDRSVVTSGAYERFVEIDGKRYQHIIDARTGWPCESDVVSATVVSASSLEADMLATTACIVGSDGLEALAQRHLDCRIVAITSDSRVLDFGGSSL